MASTIQVDKIQDTGGNTILSSNSTGTFTYSAGTGMGIIGQVVQGTYATETESSSVTYATTNVTATITPSSSSNTILVTANMSGVAKYTGNTSVGFKIHRGTATSDPEVIHFAERAGLDNGTGYNWIGSCSASIIDSPSTTSATTYTVFFNSRSDIATARIQSDGVESSITLMEILA